ncbi:MAG: cell envelope biogenesis protein TolA, partial [Pseudomonadota bacterium]|nr:cell envelope biogenesis protein TolA [Pseudomonadota bacterium]
AKVEPKPAPAKATPTKSASTPRAKEKPATGSRLGDDFLKGIGSDPAAKGTKPTGAVMSAQALSSIAAAIQRQIQPCANRQVNPGPGANRITVRLNLKLNRDGSLAGNPAVLGTLGVDDENSRYERRVGDLAIAALKGCAPLRGLPEELYAVRGGWNNFIFRYKLP